MLQGEEQAPTGARGKEGAALSPPPAPGVSVHPAMWGATAARTSTTARTTGARTMPAAWMR